ncbi:hypothetical protein C3L33_22370, partial [Rhododendron williamsianum]
MGLISGILMGTVVGIALMAGWHHMMRYRSNKRVAKAVDIKLLGSLSRDDLKKICGDNFPEWISFPVYEQVGVVIFKVYILFIEDCGYIVSNPSLTLVLSPYYGWTFLAAFLLSEMAEQTIEQTVAICCRFAMSVFTGSCAVASSHPNFDGCIYFQAATLVIKESVEPLLEQYRPPGITKLKFSKLSLGNVAPKIEGIRVQSLKKGQITMDIDFRWGGDPSIILGVEAAMVASIPIQLKDLQVFTVIRVIFQLAEEIPCISAVVVALLAEFCDDACIFLQPKPRIDYTLKAVGGSLTAIPGLSDMIDDTVNSIVTDMLQWPHRMVIPIGGIPVDTRTRRGVIRDSVEVLASPKRDHDHTAHTMMAMQNRVFTLLDTRGGKAEVGADFLFHFGADSCFCQLCSELELKPQGKLTLTVVKANDLKNMEMIGKSDPYVVVYIQILFKVKTKVIENNLNPVWNQTFELIAEDKETQSLILEVFDKDIGQDKRLGIAKVPLIELESETEKELEVRLQPSLDMLKIKDKKDRGTLTIKVQYHEFNKEEQLAALEHEKQILEARKRLKEAGVIGSTMDALDGAVGLVGSGVGLVGTGIGAGVGIVGSGFGAVGSGLSKAGKFMGRTITGGHGHAGSSKRSGTSTPVNSTQENGGVKPL